MVLDATCEEVLGKLLAAPPSLVIPVTDGVSNKKVLSFAHLSFAFHSSYPLRETSIAVYMDNSTTILFPEYNLNY